MNLERRRKPRAALGLNECFLVQTVAAEALGDFLL